MSKKNQRKIKRSGTQCCEVCKEQVRLVLHHLRGRDLKNWDGEWNRSWVCSNDHERVHFGEIIIEGWFNTTNGRQLFWHYKGEESVTGEICKPPLYTDKE